MRNYCSPSSAINENEICYTDNDLDTIIKVYNRTFSNKIPTHKIKDKFKVLNNRLKNFVGNKSYFLWINFICQHCTLQDCKKLQKIRDVRFLPMKPRSWYKNKHTWLSNIDIENVMNHYAAAPRYKYDFVGVFAVDFAEKDINGSCKFDSHCDIDLTKYRTKSKWKKCFIGMIINLDKHDQPGSHWTSMFIVMDASLPSYGIYYYDSVGNDLPNMVKPFVTNVQEQLKYIKNGVVPKIIVNTKVFQTGNSECGMFAITYQIKWLTLLCKNPLKTTEKNVLDGTMTDKNMNKNRDKFFTPSVFSNVN